MNKEPTEYRIASGYREQHLVNDVDRMIEEGWHPIGGFVISDDWYYQTMVKYEDKDKKRKHERLETWGEHKRSLQGTV